MSKNSSDRPKANTRIAPYPSTLSIKTPCVLPTTRHVLTSISLNISDTVQPSASFIFGGDFTTKALTNTMSTQCKHTDMFLVYHTRR